jgi:hypothetical protein
MEGNVGVAGESLRAPRMDRDNGFAMAPGQPAGRAFPKEMPSLLLGLSAKINLDHDTPANQLLSRDLIFLPNSSNAAPLTADIVTKKVGFTRPSELVPQVYGRP